MRRNVMSSKSDCLHSAETHIAGTSLAGPIGATLALLFLSPPSAVAQVAYHGQIILTSGSQIGSSGLAANGNFQIGALNNHGDLVFVTNAEGGGRALVRYAGGQLSVIAADSQQDAAAPQGVWPS